MSRAYLNNAWLMAVMLVLCFTVSPFFLLIAAGVLVLLNT